MSDLILTARKRAFPSTGRARINGATLMKLGIGERDEIDVGTTAKDTWITVSAFSDSMVGIDEIRLSPEDLSRLGIEEGTPVVVEKNTPLREQVEKTVQAAGDHLAGELAGLKGKLLETVEPVTAKAQASVQEAFTQVKDELPTKDEISKAIDDARKKIAPKFAPDDAGTLLSLLYKNNGAIRAVVIPAGKETTIAGLGLPAGVTAIAFRHSEGGLVVPAPDSTVTSGDTLFLIGDETLLAPALQKIGL
jgi:Putative regulatory, ligand-binding protein related to C-terminal domains of K+ channels